MLSPGGVDDVCRAGPRRRPAAAPHRCGGRVRYPQAELRATQIEAADELFQARVKQIKLLANLAQTGDITTIRGFAVIVPFSDAATQQYLSNVALLTAEEGADTLIWLATAPEPGRTTGKYYHQRAVPPTSALAADMDSAERRRQASESRVAKANGTMSA